MLEIENQIKPFVGKEFTTNANAKRKLIKIISNSTGNGMLFIGINRKSGRPNTIKKYLYFKEVSELLKILKNEKKITFTQIAMTIHGKEKISCVNHIAIILIIDFLKKGNVDYKMRRIYEAK
jgi:hypothetical protein